MRVALYVFACLLNAYWGRRHKFGFWGIFMASLLLTPLIGWVLLLVSLKSEPEEEE